MPVPSTRPSGGSDITSAPPIAPESAHEAPSDPVRPRVAAFARTRLPTWLFLGFVAAAVPLILFHFGSYHWFFRDDFVFLAGREGGELPDLWAAHGGAHWVAVPRMIYFVLWQGFGLTSYVPYQAAVVALHLTAVVLLWLVMRRAGTQTWIAAAAASVLVLFGPGAQNIVWAFQVSFVGSLAYGLAQLLLADHDGPFGRRDALGLAFGALAVMSSAVGLTMALVVGMAVLARRGWRMALAHAVPPILLYGIWSVTSDATTSTPFGRPAIGVLVDWVRTTEVETFLGLGHFPVVAATLAAVLVVGMALVWGPWRNEDLAAVRRRLAMPVALLVGGVLFATSSGLGRAWTGVDSAGGGRYVYLGAAFALPLLAVAAQAIADRWRWATPALVVLLVLPIPFNLSGFNPDIFGPDYMRQREDILTTAVRMPFARRVPRDVQPIPDPYASDDVTMGFLLNAGRNGDLTPSSRPLGPLTTNELKVRLGVAARPVSGPSPRCDPSTGLLELSPDEGDVFVTRSPMRIATRDGHRRSGPAVGYAAGSELTVELADLDLLVLPAPGAASFTLCPVR